MTAAWCFHFAAQSKHQDRKRRFTSLTDIGKLPLNIPTTLTYCTRIVPSPKHKLNIDFGVAQVAGMIYGSGSTGINLKARHQFGAQMTYGF